MKNARDIANYLLKHFKITEKEFFCRVLLALVNLSNLKTQKIKYFLINKINYLNLENYEYFSEQIQYEKLIDLI